MKNAGRSYFFLRRGGRPRPPCRAQRGCRRAEGRNKNGPHSSFLTLHSKFEIHNLSFPRRASSAAVAAPADEGLRHSDVFRGPSLMPCFASAKRATTRHTVILS